MTQLTTVIAIPGCGLTGVLTPRILNNMKTMIAVLVLLFASVAPAQDLAGAIRGALGDEYGEALNFEIPNYGWHSSVNLTLTRVSPDEALEASIAVFTALASLRDGVVSASIHAREGHSSPPFVLLFQMIDGDVSVYLNGEPYAH